jgi:hypothetical protein
MLANYDLDSVEGALFDAARSNGLPDPEIRGTLRSALDKALADGPADPPEVREPDVIEVGPGELGVLRGAEHDVLRGGADEGEPGADQQAEPTTPPSALEDIQNIEDGFWEARESLNTVYTTALGRMCSPWAVLAYTAARALTLVRPNATLPR